MHTENVYDALALHIAAEESLDASYDHSVEETQLDDLLLDHVGLKAAQVEHFLSYG